jgi:hypothetical protein
MNIKNRKKYGPGDNLLLVRGGRGGIRIFFPTSVSGQPLSLLRLITAGINNKEKKMLIASCEHGRIQPGDGAKVPLPLADHLRR